MRNILRVVVVAAAVLLMLSASALAQTQITIGASTNGTVEFTPSGSNSIMSFTGSCGGSSCVAGDAYIGSNVGTYEMWITGNNPILSPSGTPNIYAVNMNGGTMNFSFSVGTSTFAGTIQLTTLSNTSAPEFIGTLTVSSSTGIFAALWKAGSIVPLDFTISMSPGSPSIGGTTVATGTISSGEITGGTPAPEPASIALIGSGLLAIGGFVKRRMRK